MCFYKRKTQRVKIAKEDIPCYKVVRLYQPHSPHVYSSLMMGFKYTRGEEYSENKFGTDARASLYGAESEYLEKGFHSYIASRVANAQTGVPYGTTMVEFIIPKGSKYYENKNTGEYISNRIKLPSL